MDKTDEIILSILKKDARTTFQAISDVVGLSRAAIRKRVREMESSGIITGYHTTIKAENEITAFIDLIIDPKQSAGIIDFLIAVPEIRQIYRTTKENHLHIVVVSDSVSCIKTITNIILIQYGDSITEIKCHAVKETLKGE